MRKFSISLLGSFEGQRPERKPEPGGTNQAQDADPYLVAGQEVLTDCVEPSAWARALVEGGGDDQNARAAYVKLRVEALSREREAQSREKIVREEARRSMEESERAASTEAETRRRQKIKRIAQETGQSLSASEEMHDFGIQMIDGRFQLLTAAGNRYMYDRLDDAVRYAQSGRP